MKTLGKIGAVIGLLIIIALASAIGKNIGKSAVKNYEQGKIDGAIEEALLEASQQINKQLPMMVDSETRLDVTMCAGKHVAYKYTMINVSETEIDKIDFENKIKAQLVKNQCSNENTIKMLKMDVRYNYTYLDRNGILLAAININKSHCGF